ncbi:uncharacterized protein [Narcine bancroftii]|uniref:uncharacterized protein isoform X3 n=1 Tax=Narcine bancroftii TaxID=1343680 RepID=UPI0038317F28
MVLGPGSFSVFTEEALGQAEKTELYAHLANRLGKAESTKRGAEKIMKQTEVTLNQTQRLGITQVSTAHPLLPTGRIQPNDQPGQIPVLCRRKFGWDETNPESIAQDWRN